MKGYSILSAAFLSLLPVTAKAGEYFSLYAGGYGSASKAMFLSTASINKKEPGGNYQDNKPFFASLGLNGGIKLDLKWVRFYLEGFGDLSFNAKQSETFADSERSFFSSAIVKRNEILLGYKKLNIFGAKLNIALNLYFFDLYLGAGIAKQKGLSYVQVSEFNAFVGTNNKTNLETNLSTNMYVFSLGLQKEFKKFALFVDVMAFFPTDLSLKNITLENIIQESLGENSDYFFERVHGFNGSNLAIRFGGRYYF
jgi:hypothetical protein